MRLSWWSALLCSASIAAGVGALAACGPTEDEPASAETSDDEITGANNKMGLRLVYDDASGRVRATVKQKLRAGEKLVMRVRRGRLSATSQTELDCAALADAPPLPPREDVRSRKIVYDGPEVDRSLLASVYTQEWIDGNITPAMLERLSREGADAIVEACIVKDGQPRARLQTSLPYAWDTKDPNAAPTLAGRSGDVRILSSDAGAEPASAAVHSMEKYAELCVEELGDIPFFRKLADGKYETFDCRDFVGSSGPIDGIEGALVPQHVTDEYGMQVTPRECNDRDVGRHNCFAKCDAPAWAHQSCEPGPTVATAKNERGTHWTLLCRSVQGEGSERETPETLIRTKRFNDISMIGHNPRTGKTCFFQNKLFDGTDGAHVPHPGDVEKSRHVWDQPKGYCAGCHSADAFIHSPWIDGARRRDATTIVPTMGVHADFEISWNASPYSIVNREAQDRARVGGTGWERPKHLVSAEAEACTSCHRIGGGEGMARLPAWSVGEEAPSGGTSPLLPRLSDWAKRFERSHWMPPRADGITAETWPSSKYAKAARHIATCAETPTAAGCVFEDVPEVP